VQYNSNKILYYARLGCWNKNQKVKCQMVPPLYHLHAPSLSSRINFGSLTCFLLSELDVTFWGPHSYGVGASSISQLVDYVLYCYVVISDNCSLLIGCDMSCDISWILWRHCKLSTRPNVSTSSITSVKASRTLTKGFNQAFNQGFDQGFDQELLKLINSSSSASTGSWFT